MARVLIVFLICAFGVADLARATSYAPPERQEIFSDNREFLLVVDPESETHKVSRADDPGNTLWQFELPVWHFPFVVSNDGQTVAVVAWRHVQEDALAHGDCITFFSADGGRTGVAFREVYPNPPKTKHVGIGPIGDFWRTWYKDTEVSGDRLVIHTTGGGTATFDLNQRSLIGTSAVGLLKPTNLALGVLFGLLLAVCGWLLYRRKKQAEQGVAPNA